MFSVINNDNCMKANTTIFLVQLITQCVSSNCTLSSGNKELKGKIENV